MKRKSNPFGLLAVLFFALSLFTLNEAARGKGKENDFQMMVIYFALSIVCTLVAIAWGKGNRSQ